MEQVRIPRPGDIYRHFKDKLYQIITVAVHSETKEPMVVYQAMYGDFKTYVRPLASFIAELDTNEYPLATQKHRFKLVRAAGEDINEFTAKQDGSLPVSEENVSPAEAIKVTSVTEEADKTNGKAGDKHQQPDVKALSADGVNQVLMKFLEADSYYDKLDIISSNRKHLTDRLINDMAVAIDCTVEDGPLDERIQGLISCLQAMCRFEQKRSHTAYTRIKK